MSYNDDTNKHKSFTFLLRMRTLRDETYKKVAISFLQFWTIYISLTENGYIPLDA